MFLNFILESGMSLCVYRRRMDREARRMLCCWEVILIRLCLHLALQSEWLCHLGEILS